MMMTLRIRNMFYAAVLTGCGVALTGCGETEDIIPSEGGTPITFTTPDNWGDDYGGQKAATRLTTNAKGETSFQDGDEIGIYAYYHPAANSGSQEEFMINQLMTTNDGTSWEYNPIKYWPTMTGDKLSFHAYHPYDASATRAGTVSLTLNGTTDYLHASTGQISRPADGGAVSLQFKHLQNRLSFSFVQGDEYMDIGKITSITITNASTQATLDIKTGKLTSTQDNGLTLSCSIPVNPASTTNPTTSGYILCNPMQELHLTITAEKTAYRNVVVTLPSNATTKSFLITCNIHPTIITSSVSVGDWELKDNSITVGKNPNV